MKSFVLSVFIFLLTGGFVFAQQTKTCCSRVESKETKVSFATFANDETFRESHQLPVNYTLLNPKGKMIKLPTPDGDDANAYFIQSDQKSDKYILVIHEWWGLNDYIKREADELKEKLGDVNILALDLYDGKLADKREDAAKLMQNAEPVRIENIFNGAVKFSGDDAKFGTIGWCFGGGWSLQMSIWLADKGKACVMYYGIIDNTPETFENLNAPVLGIFAKQDGWVTPEVYGELKKNLIFAGKTVIIKEYDADHAFANPSNQDFDETAASDAKNHVISFFKQNLMK